jgi:hypothetical protein
MLHVHVGVGLRLSPQAASGRQLKQQVIGCINCGSNNGNNNGASVSVGQSVTQTSQGGGGGNPLPFSFPITIPFRGHRRMLKNQQQVIGCVNCGSNNGNGNGASVGVSQSVTQTSEAGGDSNPFPISFPITIPLRGHKRMLKQALPLCVDNFASCQSWGRSQCDRPDVPDKCPCMCTGTGAAGTQPPVTIIGCVNCGSNNGNGNGASVGVSQAAGK